MTIIRCHVREGGRPSPFPLGGLSFARTRSEAEDSRLIAIDVGIGLRKRAPPLTSSRQSARA